MKILPILRPNKWNHIRIHFGNGTVSFYLNRQFIKTIKIPLLIPEQIGFRGGLNTALIDNVVIRERYPPRVIKEGFGNNNFCWFLSILGIVALFNFLTSIFLKKFFKKTLKQALFVLIMGNFVLLISLSLFLLFDYFYLSRRYVHAIKTKALKDIYNKYWINSDAQSIIRQIKDIYGDRGAKRTTRILFIGTSQTWGAGAREKKETFVYRIEKKLNSNIALNGRFECINASIFGYDSSKLLDLYKDNWLVLEPQIVVIILSNNDSDPDEFYNNSIRFADLNISKGIKTLFVLEANSIEVTPGELRLHKFLKQVGQEKDIPILDLHSYLAQNYDKGFLWWDSVHLTSFGQELAADFLFEKISQEIYSSALRDNINITRRSMQ